MFGEDFKKNKNYSIGGQHSYKKHAKFNNKVPKQKGNWGVNPYPP